MLNIWIIFASFSYIAWIRFFSACREAGSIWIKKAAKGLFALLRSMPLLISKAWVLLTPVTKLNLLPSNCFARLVKTFYSQVISTSAYSPPKWCRSSMRRKSARKAGFNSWSRITSLFWRKSSSATSASPQIMIWYPSSSGCLALHWGSKTLVNDSGVGLTPSQMKCKIFGNPSSVFCGGEDSSAFSQL